MSNRVKFKIMYPKDYHDKDKAGKRYVPPKGKMVVMDGSGIFFLFDGEQYYPSITKLSHVLHKYDVVWTDSRGY